MLQKEAKKTHYTLQLTSWNFAKRFAVGSVVGYDTILDHNTKFKLERSSFTCNNAYLREDILDVIKLSDLSHGIHKLGGNGFSKSFKTEENL